MPNSEFIQKILDMRDIVDNLYDRCYEYEQKFVNHQWISVDAALPELDRDVLVYAVSKHGHEPRIVITSLTGHIWFGHAIETEPYWKDPFQYFHSDYDITHWQYLPEAPVYRLHNKESNDKDV